MAHVRDACSTLLSLRKAEGLRVRLPLARAVVATPDAALLGPHLDILRDELNVKQVELTTEVDRFGSKQLVLNPKALGPRLGGGVQDVIKAHKAGDWSLADDGATATVGGVELVAGEFDFKVVSAGDGAVATLAGFGRTGGARHHGDARTRDRRAAPAIWCARSSRRGATPDSTCPIGSC